MLEKVRQINELRQELDNKLARIQSKCQHRRRRGVRRWGTYEEVCLDCGKPLNTIVGCLPDYLRSGGYEVPEGTDPMAFARPEDSIEGKVSDA